MITGTVLGRDRRRAARRAAGRVPERDDPCAARLSAAPTGQFPVVPTDEPGHADRSGERRRRHEVDAAATTGARGRAVRFGVKRLSARATRRTAATTRTAEAGRGRRARARRPRPTPASVSSSASPMPLRRVGENVPLVTSPTRLAVGVQHRHVRARDAAVERLEPRSSRGGPAAFSASSASRPQNASFFQPTAQPDRAWTGVIVQRQVLAVQRVAHLGAQRVAGAEPGRQAAERRGGLDSASHSAAVSSHAGMQLVAVLAGVAGAADPHRRGPAEARRRRRPCSPARPAARARRAPRPSAGPARRARRSRRCWSVTSMPSGAAAASRRTTSAVLAAFGTRNTSSSPTR